jgi:hypothetical protein
MVGPLSPSEGKYDVALGRIMLDPDHKEQDGIHPARNSKANLVMCAYGFLKYVS